MNGKDYYYAHRENLLTDKREYYLRNREEILIYKKQFRLAHIEEDLARKRIYNKTHKQELAQYRQKAKAEGLTHYGNGVCACVRCGESRLPCLSIDHINGGGTRHLASIKRGGFSFCLWLKQQGYPEGYQTLCMNCQAMKKYENKEHRYSGR